MAKQPQHEQQWNLLRTAHPPSPAHLLAQLVPALLQADLLAMRKLLRSVVQYFEQDGTATVDHVPESTIELPDDVALIDGAVPWGCALPAA